MKIFLQGLLAGVAVFIVSFLVNMGSEQILPSLAQEFKNPNMFRPWSDPLMSLFFVYPFVLGIVLSFIWNKVKKLFTDRSFWKRGAQFGLLYWVAAAIPGMLITYSSFTLSLTMVMVWTIGGLLEALTAGIVLARTNK